MQNLNAEYDVVIVGGGPAGCATALALHNLGVQDILVAEFSDYSKPRIGECIPPDTRGLLSRLGLWQAFEREGHKPSLGSYSCWGNNELGFNDYLFNPRGYGWHLDRQRFDLFMADQVRLRGIHLHTQLPFKQLVPHVMKIAAGDGYAHNVLFANGQSVKARFVVDATGRASKVARRLGATRKVDDKLVCVAAYFENSESAGEQLKCMTLLEAVEVGWWYAARLPNNRTIVTIASDQHSVYHRELAQPDGWHNALSETQYVYHAIGQPSEPAELLTWVAPSVLLNPPAGNGWLAVGDAASAYDPISAQGIYKALQNGLDSAPAIVQWLDGITQGILDYRQNVGQQFMEYLEQRAFFYDLETRWPKSEFWRSRQGGRVAVAYSDECK